MPSGIYEHKKGYKRPLFSKVWRERIGIAGIGRKLSKETREKIGKGNSKPKLEIGRKNIANANIGKNKGRKQTIIEKQKRSESLKKAYREGRHPNWKGGITSNNQKIRDSEEYKIWRLEVFFRDNFTCKKCNIDNKNIVQAHHIENFTNKELRFDVSNGITFCKACHKLFHHIYGVKNNTTEQLTEFLNKT